MKQIVKTSRLAGQLEKLFRMLNEDFFDGQLETPIITIQSTPRAYGHVSVNSIWTVNGEEKRREERGLCKPRGREYSEITAVSGADRVKLQRGQWRDSHDRSTWNR